MLTWIVVSLIALLSFEVSSCKNVQEVTRHEAAISKRSADEGCWFREEYRSCGTACPDTCENYGRNNSCTRECVPGCFCKKGYVRDSRSRFQMCILPEDCTNPPVCNRVGEHFSKCGTKCPLTCGNMDDPPLCQASCAVGCFCNEGLVRNATGSCIHPENCPPKPPSVCATVGEKLDHCGCELKCTGRIGEYVNHCPEYCIQSCACKRGLARHPTNGSCTLPRNCPTLP